ncbi:helix-turn-helix domain-containing protein [Agrobacterium rosae]|uniref:Helix-turn-helix domain-containing protein n=1 Tax=Agrobacterium rosae TaxID=1972867 RepID=A0AAW9FER6_9HYPH|nr:helix-turn-helix domain-containing protein [Agrobacterium rosae]MDX8301450.1 helix-turn-helix domain-containing protein [Agrobacterium rosae]
MHRVSDGGKQSRAERKRLEEIARIKGKLIVAEIKLTDIDEKYKLPRGTAGNAIHEPHVAGERAIAAALNTRPHLLWFSRYHSSGKRLSPQPSDNYRNGRRSETETSRVAA